LLQKILAMVVVLLLCSACAKIDKKFGAFKPDRDADYLKEEPTPALKMPAGYHLDSRFANDYFPLPQGPRPAPDSQPVGIIPPTLTSSVGETDDAKS